MLASQLRSGFRDWNEKIVAVTGRLIVDGHFVASIADSFEAYEMRESIAVDDSFYIGNYLVTVLPVYGGGPCMFNEICTIVGTCLYDGCECRLSKIQSCLVVRDEFRIDVPFGKLVR